MNTMVARLSPGARLIALYLAVLASALVAAWGVSFGLGYRLAPQRPSAALFHVAVATPTPASSRPSATPGPTSASALPTSRPALATPTQSSPARTTSSSNRSNQTSGDQLGATTFVPVTKNVEVIAPPTGNATSGDNSSGDNASNDGSNPSSTGSSGGTSTTTTAEN